jgi:hypothetical protein
LYQREENPIISYVNGDILDVKEKKYTSSKAQNANPYIPTTAIMTLHTIIEAFGLEEVALP